MSDWKYSKIPKILHLYWDGSSMSYLQYMTAFSFRKFNPDWEIKIYMPNHKTEIKTWVTSEQKTPYTGKNYFDELKKCNVTFLTVNTESLGINQSLSEVHKSDYFRWYVLYKEGGIWSDFDILYIKPITQLNIEDNNIDTGLAFDGSFLIGFFLSRKENDFFKNIYDNSKLFINSYDYQAVGSAMFGKRFKTFDNCKSQFPQNNMVNIEMPIVYPFVWNETRQIFEQNRMDKIKETTLGIHWFNGCDISKNYNNNFDARCKENTTINNLLAIVKKST